ncbi:unnamed protein product [Zymoseptoria tritici ST99CH_3D1]|nr:unnamed protein product [Zymoseptoria tritici ST99CH_3D1]
MPTGHLTPLGRQLRTVLANLSVKRTTNNTCGAPTALKSASHGRRSLQNVAHSNPIASLDDEPTAAIVNAPVWRKTPPTSSRVVKKRGHIDHITNALKEVGHEGLIPKRPPGKWDLSYVNLKRKSGFGDAGVNARRHARDVPPDHTHTANMTLGSILGSYIRAVQSQVDILEADWNKSYTFSQTEIRFLRVNGYTTTDDISAWADIVTTSDSLSAARKLSERAASGKSTPAFILLHVLRRKHISGAALRILILSTFSTLYGQSRSHMPPRLHGPPLFLAIIRLMRHARKVWPQALASIVSIWLRHLQHTTISNKSRAAHQQLAARTFELNKLLSLVSLSTSLEPFKHVAHRSAAIVPILQFMSEHKPPLLIDRTGYRAVIRVQLAQPKAEREQQWAELKALSWPPWKVDRTGMDASIGLDYGVSQAGATLDAMKDAGYRPLAWEQVARLYAGWDTDGTPTIQTRALLCLPGYLNSEKSPPRISLWAARIECTRTVQEAWACYLAWEELHEQHNQMIYLAIFTKLNEEAKARSKSGIEDEETEVESRYQPPLPGDGKEIFPPPRSTHLHTYTRTSPPTVDELYTTLRERGAVFGGHCLAFLVRNATSLQIGLDRLEDSTVIYPQLRGVQSLQPSISFAKVPDEVFAATITLFSRFALHGTKTGENKTHVTPASLAPTSQLHTFHGLNHKSGMAHAVDLLLRRPFSSTKAYLDVLEALASAHRRLNLHVNYRHDPAAPVRNAAMQVTSPAVQAGALLAYNLMRRTMSAYREQHRPIDLEMFAQICQCTEHAAYASWMLLQNELDPDWTSSQHLSPRNAPHAVAQAKQFARDKDSLHFLVDHFSTLVGTSYPIETSSSTPDQDDDNSLSDLPRLLAVPFPQVLHRYIRALGWMGAHEELLNLVKWMHTHQVELAERAAVERGGEKATRQVVRGLRVFLERTWVKKGSEELEEVGDGDDEIKTILEGLRRPARPRLVDEVRELVESVEGWPGWPGKGRVERYLKDARFEAL